MALPRPICYQWLLALGRLQRTARLVVVIGPLALGVGSCDPDSLSIDTPAPRSAALHRMNQPINKNRSLDADRWFRLDRSGVIKFMSGQRARAVEIQSVGVAIRRNTVSSFPLWIAWLVAGLVVNGAMGASTNGGEYNSAHGFVSGLGLVGGPIAILLYRARKGVFLDVEGTGSRITSLEVGPYTAEVEDRAYELADELIAMAEDNC